MEPPLPQRWDEPPWAAPLDPDAAIAAIPPGATMTGTFLAGVVGMARAKGVALATARPSYVPFRPYPLKEHCALLVEASRAVFPDQPLRQGLRRIGRGAPGTLVGSMLGKVVLGSVEGPVEILKAMAKSYGLYMKPSALEVHELSPGDVVVRLEQVWHFLDSHNVGVFEGALRFAGVEGEVRIHVRSASSADFRCTFRPRV